MEDKISTMQNYMFMLVEQLRYSLHHLDSSNVTDIDMDKTRIYSGGITLQTIIKDNEKFSAIEQTVEKIHAAVYGEDGESDIVIGAGGIAAQVKDLQSDMTTAVRLDSDGLYVIDEKGKTVYLGGGDIIFDGVLASGDRENWIQMQDVESGPITVAHVNHYYSGWNDGELPITSFGYQLGKDSVGRSHHQWYLTAIGNYMMVYDDFDQRFRPQGTWDFVDCDLINSSMKVTAVFA